MGRYPWAELLIFKVLQTIFFYPTRQNAYRVVIITAMICVAWPICLTPEATDPLRTKYHVGCTISFYFGFVAYLLFAEGTFPDHWRRVRDEVHVTTDAGDRGKLPSNFPLTKKLWWMVDIAHSVRMVGWIQEPQAGVPPHPPPSRRAFLWKTSFKLIANVAAADIAISLLALSPALDYRVHDPTDGPDTYLTAVPFLRRVPYILLLGIGTGASVGVIHNLTSLIFVGFGSSPTLWPDMWGRWRDAYTVRKLWGQTWHQSLRPTLGGLGRLIANKFLKFPRGTNRSSYTQLYAAFLLSALIHSCGDFVLTKGLAYPSLKFFPLQAVAITFEDFFIYIVKGLLRRGGIELKQGKADESWVGAVVKVIGYCWVIVWFCLVLPVWVDELDVAGFGSFDRGPISQFVLDRWKQWV